MSFEVCAFAHVASSDGLFIPLYRKDRSNIYHVSITGRDLKIEEFIPWVLPEEFIADHHRDADRLPLILKNRTIGDYSIVAFELSGQFIAVSVEEIRSIYNNIQAEIRGSLLDIQLARMASTPISQLHDKFVSFSSKVFRRKSSAKLYVTGSISLAQNDIAIWKSIDQTKSRSRSDEEEFVRGILTKQREGLIQWLLDNTSSTFWPRIWIATEDRIGLEGRLEQLALDWLAAAEGDWLGDQFGTAVFRRMLSSYELRSESPFDFTDALFGLISGGEVFSPEALLSASDYLKIYNVMAKNSQFGSIDGVLYLTNLLRRTPYDAKVIDFCLGQLLDDLEKIDLSNYQGLKRAIVDFVIRSDRLEQYRRIASIREKLGQLRRLMRIRHSVE